ncbi:glycosyltransferase family 2 protein [Chryseobacterium polytrichastri]|uniref:Glycosyl transferase family 2 n=1 Tax=Chryseobacterium polytrichastri TaxID=1302687 RepID=A0A1M7F614_9FLAO|nr:glycosyltransferase [Chryseobacterium polytrichastri]SHL99149.1 Glycosyl transferase family 2 [Chryseobacterium polytrichastri]
MNKVSILIANYNNGKYFLECYNSIINQTYNNWEVIIVDDASTDDSIEVIKSIIQDDTRFKLYENSSNKGCGFTKRKCMEHATGDICAYLDPDDALYPIALEESIEEYLFNNKIVATYSKMMMCDENLNPQKTFSATKQIFNDKYFFNCPIQFAHFFTFKKEAYQETQGINPNLKSAVDQDLYLKILELGDVAFINEDLYLYRQHSNGISQQSSKQKAKDSFAKVIHETMKRRGIKIIHNQDVPDQFTNAEEIYQLLHYQTEPLFRLRNRLKLTFM